MDWICVESSGQGCAKLGLGLDLKNKDLFNNIDVPPTLDDFDGSYHISDLDLLFQSIQIHITAMLGAARQLPGAAGAAAALCGWRGPARPARQLP